jgi:hypothetical protein
VEEDPKEIFEAESLFPPNKLLPLLGSFFVPNVEPPKENLGVVELEVVTGAVLPPNTLPQNENFD